MPAKPPTPAGRLRRGGASWSPLQRIFPLLLAALVAGALAPAAHAAFDAKYEGISADGSVAFFTSKDRLVSGDTDNKTDLFARSFDESVGEYVTRQVSLSSTGGNAAHDVQYSGVSADGTKAFFVTNEPLVPNDDDEERDIYLRNLSSNTTERVSRGDSTCEAQGCGNGAAPSNVILDGVIPTATKIVFATTEKLTPDDKDNRLDIYVRNLSANTTVRVSKGASSCEAQGCGNGDVAVSVVDDGVATDGNRVFFVTTEKLVPEDTDSAVDIYVRNLSAPETTQLVSKAGICPSGLPAGENCDPNFAGASDDGSHAFFETNESLSIADDDESQDVYDWAEGLQVLVSVGSDGLNKDGVVTYGGSSADGEEVFLRTVAPLDVTADLDTAQDIYRRAGGVTSLVSAGDLACMPICGNGPEPAELAWVSPDDSTGAVFFATDEPLVPEDEDSAQDVYERSGGETTLISQGDASCAADECGNGSLDSVFARASNDGLHVFFVTDESLLAPDPEDPLLPADTDEYQDIYERFAGATKLVSTGLINGNGPFDAALHGVSASGSRAFFVTKERLTETDDFGLEDVYSRSAGGTQLVSVGNNPDLILGPPPPFLKGTTPGSPNLSLTPTVYGEAEAGAAIKLYDKVNCEEGEPVATGTAAELADPGIPVTVAAGSTTSFWATAEVDGIVSPCSNAVTYKQAAPSTPPPPPAPESGSGTGGTSGGSSGGTGSGSGGSVPKTHNGGIAYVAPETRITFGPSFKTKKRKVVFRFFDATGQPGSSFLCRLDQRKWQACSSPTALRGLTRGKHVFRIKAKNAIGVWEAQPAKRPFKVVQG
jgi:hypothetical protein